MPTSHPKVILITGCSSGFGLLTAARLASRGHHVIATMRNLQKQTALQNEVNVRSGKVTILRLDVTENASIEEVMSQIGAEFGYLDVVINNAGFGMGGCFEDLTEEQIRYQMEVNFFGVQKVIRRALPLMRPRRQGKIINISSIAGFSASPGFGAYNASKWALEGFSESLRYELSLFGIDVLLIEPGVYPTKIFYENRRYAERFDDKDSPYYSVSQHLKKRVMDYVADCHKDPEEIAELCEKLIDAKHPPFRNVPDLESRVMYFFRKFLPFRLYSWIVKKASFKEFEIDE